MGDVCNPELRALCYVKWLHYDEVVSTSKLTDDDLGTERYLR